MSIEKRLRQALEPIGWDVANAVYRGESDRYIVLQHSDIPDFFGDDAPLDERVLVSAHLYAPVAFNILATERAAKRALHAAGFTWPSREDASDGDSLHIVLECEDMVGVNPDGDDAV